MKKVSLLVESFLSKNNSFLPKLPIYNIKNKTEIFPVNKWQSIDKKFLRKKFSFFKYESRNQFISEIIAYENETLHRGVIIINELDVTLEIGSKDLGMIAEPDKEYAKNANLIYKEICYGEQYAKESQHYNTT